MILIRLLGRPAIVRDGQPVRAPRGRKAWALLAYVLLAERPPSRRQLAELLFADADDPLGALRWSLAELRRALGQPGLFTGDPVRAGLDDQVAVDLDGDGELLDGIEVDGCPEFESWLVVARHRVAATVSAHLRHRAIELVAAGRAAEAVPLAARVVARNSLEESSHELLVRCLAVAGDRSAAERQVAVAEDLLRRELGIEPSAALREAATVGPASPVGAPRVGRASALSQLEAGRAAIDAGATDAGLQCLRRAVAEAQQCGDDQLRARALVTLGGALVHAVRGRDEEGSVVLHEAIRVATVAGDPAVAVTALRELGFVEVQAGRRVVAAVYLTEAAHLADSDEELAAIRGVQGMDASDRADYPAAFALLDESVQRARSANAPRQQAWSLSIVARAHLLRDERRQAGLALTAALEIISQQRWLAFLPWPQALRAELSLLDGDLDAAGDTLEHAWALASQLGDPCWEGMAARGLGLVYARRGDIPTAAQWLGEATTRCVRVPDRYQWVHGFVLDTAAALAIERGDGAAARPLVDGLVSLAARCDLRELLVRALMHRHRLGDPDALAAAHLHAAGIDNPVLLTGSSRVLEWGPTSTTARS